MSVQAPWLMSMHADTAGADERAYIDEADRVVDAKTNEYVRGLDSAR